MKIRIVVVVKIRVDKYINNFKEWMFYLNVHACSARVFQRVSYFISSTPSCRAVFLYCLNLRRLHQFCLTKSNRSRKKNISKRIHTQQR
jgi:hypothetical protein